MAFDERVGGLVKTTGRLTMDNRHQLHPDLLNLVDQLRHIEAQLYAHRGEVQDNQQPIQAQRCDALVHRVRSWWKRLWMGLQKVATQMSLHLLKGDALVHRVRSWWKRLGMGLQKVATQMSLHLLKGIENVERRAVHQPAGETAHAGMLRTHQRLTRRDFGLR